MFESRHRPVFGEEDVVNMFPVVKHLKPTGTDATGLVQHAQVLIQQGERHCCIQSSMYVCYVCMYVCMFTFRVA